METVLGLYAPGAFLGNDNLLFPSDPFVDFSGISYSAGAGFNLYNNSVCGTDQYFELASGGGCGAGNLISLAITPFIAIAGDSYFAYSYTGTGIEGVGYSPLAHSLVVHARSLASKVYWNGNNALVSMHLARRSWVTTIFSSIRSLRRF